MSLKAALSDMARACAESAIVEACSVRVVRFPVLSLRARLIDGSFVEAFGNIRNGKGSFALIVGTVRAYGKDNSGAVWHVHPYDCPARHEPCPPCTFAEFLAEVEALRFGG